MALLLLLLLLSIGAASAAGAPPSAIRLGEPSLVGNGRYTAWTLAALPNPQRGGAMDLLDSKVAAVRIECVVYYSNCRDRNQHRLLNLSTS